jgi:hypothetical protein
MAPWDGRAESRRRPASRRPRRPSPSPFRRGRRKRYTVDRSRGENGGTGNGAESAETVACDTAFDSRSPVAPTPASQSAAEKRERPKEERAQWIRRRGDGDLLPSPRLGWTAFAHGACIGPGALSLPVSPHRHILMSGALAAAAARGGRDRQETQKLRLIRKNTGRDLRLFACETACFASEGSQTRASEAGAHRAHLNGKPRRRPRSLCQPRGSARGGNERGGTGAAEDEKNAFPFPFALGTSGRWWRTRLGVAALLRVRLALCARRVGLGRCG